MILHENTLLSFDVFDIKFNCHLEKCKGNCCVEGDYGAPLETGEISIIEENISFIKPYMTRLGLNLLEKEGFYLQDPKADLVTNCIYNKDCIFVYREKGINLCAIEKAWTENKISFQKPISCHLYPIRLSKINNLTAINYSKWDICKSALELGKSNKIPLYVFLKDSLIRKFGKPWYDELDHIARELKKVRNKF